MSSFLEPLYLEADTDGTFIVKKEFSYSVGSLDSDIIITVPVNTRTDFASIPPILGIFLPKLGKYNKPSCLHDFLYSKVREKKFSRAIADALLLESMLVCGVSWYKRWPIYLGVRLFGWMFC